MNDQEYFASQKWCKPVTMEEVLASTSFRKEAVGIVNKGAKTPLLSGRIRKVQAAEVALAAVAEGAPKKRWSRDFTLRAKAMQLLVPLIGAHCGIEQPTTGLVLFVGCVINAGGYNGNAIKAATENFLKGSLHKNLAIPTWKQVTSLFESNGEFKPEILTQLESLSLKAPVELGFEPFEVPTGVSLSVQQTMERLNAVPLKFQNGLMSFSADIQNLLRKEYEAEAEAENSALPLVSLNLKKILRFTNASEVFVQRKVDRVGRIHELGAVRFQGDKWQRLLFTFSEEEGTPDLERVALAKAGLLKTVASKRDDFRAAARAYVEGIPHGYVPCAGDMTASGFALLGLALKWRQVLLDCNVIGTELGDFHSRRMEEYNSVPGVDFNRDQAKGPSLMMLYGAQDPRIIEETGLKSVAVERVRTLLDLSTGMGIYQGAIARLTEDYHAGRSLLPIKFRGPSIEGRWVEEDGTLRFPAVRMPDGHVVAFVKGEAEHVEAGPYRFRNKVVWSSVTSAIAPGLIHAIDAYLLRKIVRMFPKEAPLLTVHDCFVVPSSQWDTLIRCTHRALREIAAERVLDGLLWQLGARPIGTSWSHEELAEIANPHVLR